MLLIFDTRISADYQNNTTKEQLKSQFKIRKKVIQYPQFEILVVTLIVPNVSTQ